MQLPVSYTDLDELINKLPQKKIAQAIVVILAIYIAYLLAQLTWLLLPSAGVEQSSLVAKPTLSQQDAKKSLDLTALKNLHLFGQFHEQKKTTEVKVQDAPETKLRLTLSGTVASDDANIAAAVIENNGKQETYGIGDKITGTRATLESVATDRVLIKQSGRLETLMLDGFKYSKSTNTKGSSLSKITNFPVNTKGPSSTKSAKVVDQRDNQKLRESAKRLKDDIQNSPGKIIDYLRIIPKRQNGAIIGYQLRPGKNKEFFQSSGLKSGDVAVQMNGLDLTVPSEAAQAMQTLKEETELSLLIERNGEMTEILFSIQE